MKFLSPHDINGFGPTSSRGTTSDSAGAGPSPGGGSEGMGGESIWPYTPNNHYYQNNHSMSSPVPQPPSPANHYHHPHPHQHHHPHYHPHHHSHYNPYDTNHQNSILSSTPHQHSLSPSPAAADVIYVTTPANETLPITFPANSIASGEIRVLDIKREVARALHTSPDFVRLFLGHGRAEIGEGSRGLTAKVRSVGWDNGVVGACVVDERVAKAEAEAEAEAARAGANAGRLHQSHEQWQLDEERRWQEHEHWRRQQEMSWEERIRRWETEQSQWQETQEQAQTQTQTQAQAHMEQEPRRASSYDVSHAAEPDSYVEVPLVQSAFQRPAASDHGHYSQPPSTQQQQPYAQPAYPETHLQPPTPVLPRSTPTMPRSPQARKPSSTTTTSPTPILPDSPPPKYSASIPADELIQKFEENFRIHLGPRMDRYIASPPREEKPRDTEYGLLYQRSLNETMCEMDRIEIDDRNDLRERRKALINAVLAKSEKLDEAYVSVGGEKRGG